MKTTMKGIGCHALCLVAELVVLIGCVFWRLAIASHKMFHMNSRWTWVKQILKHRGVPHTQALPCILKGNGVNIVQPERGQRAVP